MGLTPKEKTLCDSTLREKGSETVTSWSHTTYEFFMSRARNSVCHREGEGKSKIGKVVLGALSTEK